MRLSFRKDTAANWAALNPVLALGEPVYVIDTGKFVIGDGVSQFTSLNPAGGSGGLGLVFSKTQADWVQGDVDQGWSVGGLVEDHEAPVAYKLLIDLDMPDYIPKLFDNYGIVLDWDPGMAPGEEDLLGWDFWNWSGKHTYQLWHQNGGILGGFSVRSLQQYEGLIPITDINELIGFNKLQYEADIRFIPAEGGFSAVGTFKASYFGPTSHHLSAFSHGVVAFGGVNTVNKFGKLGVIVDYRNVDGYNTHLLSSTFSVKLFTVR